MLDPVAQSDVRAAGAFLNVDQLPSHPTVSLGPNSSNSSPDHLKNYEAIEPTFNVVPSSACQRNAI